MLQPRHIPDHPNIVVNSYPDGVPRLQLPQPGATAPAPGHVPPPIQTKTDERLLSTRPGAPPENRAPPIDPFKKPDIGKFEAVAGAKCFICRLSIPPGSKDFPSRNTNLVTCSRCKKVAFGGQQKTIEPIPKFPTACNASLAEKMTKLRKAQAFIRMKKKVAKQRAMGIRPGKGISASAPSSPAPMSPMPPSPASLPPRSPGGYMPKSPLPSSSSSLPPPSPGLMPPSPSSLPPHSPSGAPPKSPMSSHSRSHGLQPRSPMSLPPRSPCSMPASPQPPGYHSYPASPSAPNLSRPPMSPVIAPRQPSPAGSVGSHHESPEKSSEMLNPNANVRNSPLVPSPRHHPQQREQSPASSTSSERLSLPPGREQDDTTIRALLQLGRTADRVAHDPSGVPVVVLQRGDVPTRSNIPSYSQHPSGEQTPTSMPNTPTMISPSGHHLIPGTPTSTTPTGNTLSPGYPTGPFPYMVQQFSPGTPGSEKSSPVPKLSRTVKPGVGQPQYIPASAMSPRLTVPKQPHYISADGKYVIESQSDNRPDSIVIVGTNCAGSSSITVGNDLKDPYASVPPSLQVPKQQLTEMYGKPGFRAFYCSCSGRQIMLLQCPDCDFVCNNLLGMELHIAAQRHAESRAKASASDMMKYSDEQGSGSHRYESDREMEDDRNDETMSQSSVDTQSADMDTEGNSPRYPREASRKIVWTG